MAVHYCKVSNGKKIIYPPDGGFKIIEAPVTDGAEVIQMIPGKNPRIEDVIPYCEIDNETFYFINGDWIKLSNDLFDFNIDSNRFDSFKELDGYIRTRSGKIINVLKPKVEDIDIDDMARGLAFNSHFRGQSEYFFSTAEHSLMVEDMVPPHWGPWAKMAALLHDGSDPYLCDLAKPVKVFLQLYVDLENRFMKIIFERFKIDLYLKDIIKPFDIKVQEIESRAFFDSIKDDRINYYPPQVAYEMFLSRFQLLTAECEKEAKNLSSFDKTTSPSSRGDEEERRFKFYPLEFTFLKEETTIMKVSR